MSIVQVMPVRIARWIVLIVVGAVLYVPAPARAAVDYDMVFPVAGPVSFTDTFGDPRSGGRTHEGQDLISDKMTPVVAVADGIVGWMHDEQGGDCCAMALEHDDGWASWYIHLNNDTPGTDDGQGWGFASGIETGVHVVAGQLIGFVGDSGNAEETVSHLHFELHDQSDTPVNSYESLLAAPQVDPTGPPIPNEGCDFDNDGRFDLAVGSTSGLAVYYGASLETPLTVSDADVSAVGCGDFNHDTYDDLVIGSSSPGEDGGSITVFSGSPAGLDLPGATLDQASPGVPGANEIGDRMGEALAVGDIDGDSFDDLAVGLPGEAFGSRADVGMILVFWGSGSGLTGAESDGLSQATSGTAGGAETGDSFGAALTAGDFDADGYADIAVGIPGEGLRGKSDAGAVHVFYGSPSGIDLGNDRVWAQSSPGIKGGAEPDDRFGASLATGDFDHDGFDELLVGVVGEDIGSQPDAGAVNLIRGSDSGLTAKDDMLIHQGGSGVAGAPESGDALGSALVAADFDSDGWMDLAIGIAGEGIGSAAGSGAVQIMFGFIDRPATLRDFVLSQASPGVAGAAEIGDSFGSSLYAADVSDDGYPDLVAGSPGEDVSSTTDAGLVTVLGLDPTVTHFSHHPGQAGLGLAANTEFGLVGE